MAGVEAQFDATQLGIIVFGVSVFIIGIASMLMASSTRAMWRLHEAELAEADNTFATIIDGIVSSKKN